MSEAPPNAPEYAKQSRARRVLGAVIGGLGLDAIGAEEKIAADRVETIVREELGRRWVAPVADIAKIQIARLENLALLLLDRLQTGELKAVDRALKIFDRLDRYHGFSRANPVLERYGEEDREKLLDKINAAAARLEADKSGE
jgi:hypothetical protein